MIHFFCSQHAETNGKCQYVETEAFQDDFTAFNASRWDLNSTMVHNHLPHAVSAFSLCGGVVLCVGCDSELHDSHDSAALAYPCRGSSTAIEAPFTSAQWHDVTTWVSTCRFPSTQTEVRGKEL